jgi:hypothetical protein
MSREDIERNRDTQNPRTSQKDISNDEQRAGNLPNDGTAHDLQPCQSRSQKNKKWNTFNSPPPYQQSHDTRDDYS